MVKFFIPVMNISYFLWLAVWIRFLLPVSLESDFGIIPAVSVSRAEETYTRKETE